jgi:hypothetical protein
MVWVDEYPVRRLKRVLRDCWHDWRIMPWAGMSSIEVHQILYGTDWPTGCRINAPMSDGILSTGLAKLCPFEAIDYVVVIVDWHINLHFPRIGNVRGKASFARRVCPFVADRVMLGATDVALVILYASMETECHISIVTECDPIGAVKETRCPCIITIGNVELTVIRYGRRFVGRKLGHGDNDYRSN